MRQWTVPGDNTPAASLADVSGGVTSLSWSKSSQVLHTGVVQFRLAPPGRMCLRFLSKVAGCIVILSPMRTKFISRQECKCRLCLPAAVSIVMCQESSSTISCWQVLGVTTNSGAIGIYSSTGTRTGSFVSTHKQTGAPEELHCSSLASQSQSLCTGGNEQVRTMHSYQPRVFLQTYDSVLEIPPNPPRDPLCRCSSYGTARRKR